MSMKESDRYKYHIAISFAGEDRQVAENVARLLRERGISVFYDDYEKADLWGKDLYEYLAAVYSAHARYCIMLISEHYAKKLWTNHERKNAQERAFKENAEYILPVRLDDTAIPGIRDTVGYIDLRKTAVEDLVDLILQKLGKAHASTGRAVTPNDPDVPMPQIRKKFTDRDRDKFIKESFVIIKEYFRKGLRQLETHQEGIETDYTGVHEFKFLAKVYVHGDTKCQCKIWLGGFTASSSILYSEGTLNIDSDNSYNDFLSVEDDGNNLYLKIANMGYVYAPRGNTGADAKGAAEYLWKRFISNLEQ